MITRSAVLALAFLGVTAFAEIERTVSEEFATMRDGVRLAANVYTPTDAGPWPVILTRTPYTKDNRMFTPGSASRYTDAGYVFVIQDVRGRGHSAGVYAPFANDRLDGHDTVEWAAKQTWSNGKVGISGASAMGIIANLAASANPPSLAAAFVVIAPQSTFHEFFYPGGVFRQADGLGWHKMQNDTVELAPLRARALWSDDHKRSDFRSDIDQVHIPIYNVGGWYDIFSVGAVRNFMYLQHQGAEGARGNQKLMMGPFGHGNLEGKLRYPKGGGLGGSFRDELRWFDHWLKGIDNGIMLEPTVRYYMMGHAMRGHASLINGYYRRPDWPPPYTAVPYYLRLIEGADDVEVLELATEAEPKRKRSVSYRFDPSDPVPTVGGSNMTLPLGPMDQRAIDERDDYLRFQTPPLREPVAVAGPVTFELWASTDGPDTDFMVKLVDVYPNGYEALVLDSPIRLRFRNGQRVEDVDLMTPGEPVKLTIDLFHTAITFQRAHRIALHVTSSNSPRFDVNYNNDAPLGDPGEPRVATNTIYMDRNRPSALILPVVVE